MRRRFCMLALLLSALAPGAGAMAASPPGTLAAARRRRRLRVGSGRRSAARLRAASTTPARSRSAPTACRCTWPRPTPASVTAFSVAPGNGLLQQLNLGAGCLASIAQDGCGTARALEGASAIVVSPDNLHVYVAVGRPRHR